MIRVGKNISPFQPPSQVIRVGHSFRSNGGRAIRVGFSLKCYPTIPACRLGSSRLDQLLFTPELLLYQSFETFFQLFYNTTELPNISQLEHFYKNPTDRHDRHIDTNTNHNQNTTYIIIYNTSITNFLLHLHNILLYTI